MEIEKAVEAADAIIVCLSKGSITKEGYVQKEIKTALDYSDHKPEGAVFIIPIRLEDCKPPNRLSKWQYEDYFGDKRERAIQRLLVSLKVRAESIGLELDLEDAIIYKGIKFVARKETLKPIQNVVQLNEITLSNGMEFIRVPAGKFIMGSDNDSNDEKPQHTVDIPYDYWMARYPLTNELYSVYSKAKGIKHPVSDWEKKKDHPVIYVNWIEAMAYCQWLKNLLKAELPSDSDLRLPTEAEWEKASRGIDGRIYPWGNKFDIRNCNTFSNMGFRLDKLLRSDNTTPVRKYSPQGDSPWGCGDMVGNVWEWTHSVYESYPYNVEDGREHKQIFFERVLRGGGYSTGWNLRCAVRLNNNPTGRYSVYGFRIALVPKLSL
jgi:formylglycine-generating enzyme required for sulfatase activity